MIGFVARRVALAVFVVLVVTLLVSWAIRLTGDPAIMLAQGAGSVTEEDLQRIRIALGLDRPFPVQYLGFLQGLLSGDLGRSFLGNTPVTLLVGLSFPNFWLAMMMVLVFSIALGWLPPSGMEGAASLVMPAATMAIILTATNVRLVRTAMLETLSAQYVMVARSKGLRERVVLYKHALRNSLIPLITVVMYQIPQMLAGAVVIEQVFAWPGMGSLAFDAIAARDYPVLQAVITVLAILIVVINLAVDIAYGLVDPRIRTE